MTAGNRSEWECFWSGEEAEGSEVTGTPTTCDVVLRHFLMALVGSWPCTVAGYIGVDCLAK